MNATAPPANSRLQRMPWGSVGLLPSRWADQVAQARGFYVGLNEDDVLHGFRVAADLPAPGESLTGWAQPTSSVVFGQWLSTLARFGASGDQEAGEKAIRLFEGWETTWRKIGYNNLVHYDFDKLVGGLVDIGVLLEHRPALVALTELTEQARSSLNRQNVAAVPWPENVCYGSPLEWYTLSENLYRAYVATSDELFREFAAVWHYDAYWGQFEKTTRPELVYGLHAYSHLNTFSGAAMAYRVTGEPRFLEIIKNAYTWFRETQTYATGGYGPVERTMVPDGRLGEILDTRPDTFEAPCGSWAGFKLSSYLLEFTGSADYGDWIERLLYNGVGAALPILPDGHQFYYADYRVAGGAKTRYPETYACCSGSLGQDVTDYQALIYYQDDSDGLYINLYLPSVVNWEAPGGRVQLTQETSYPEDSIVRFTIDTDGVVAARLSFRAPLWAEQLGLSVNGEPARGEEHDGWITLDRQWESGDVIELTIPLEFRGEPVDAQHPNRQALVRGPIVMAFSQAPEPFPQLPAFDSIGAWLEPDDRRQFGWRFPRWPDHFPAASVRPYYEFDLHQQYRMYIDIDKLPNRYW